MRNSGKTRLSWTITHENPDWDYYPWIPNEPTTGDKIIIDHVPATRFGTRTVREILNFDKPEVVIAISREPLHEVEEKMKLTT